MLKKVIIGILCFVILAVTGLGVYLYTLDWNKHKNIVAQRFSQITGLKASIDGNLNVKLFPKPSFSAGMVKFTKNGSRDPLFEINDIKADVELMPLLDNKFVITSMTLTGATTHLIISEKGDFNWNGVKGSNKNKSGNIEVSFNDVRLVSSYVSYQNKQTKKEFEIPNISANISATSLKGPYRTSGKFIHNKSEINFSGDIINDKDITLRMAINNASTGSKLSIDGSFGPKAKGNVTFDSRSLYDIVSVIFGENKFPNTYDEAIYISFQYDHNNKITKLDNFTTKYGKQTAGSGTIDLSKDLKWNINADFDMLQFDLGLIENIAKNIVNSSESSEKNSDALNKYNANINIKSNHAMYRNADVQKLILGIGFNDGIINVNRFSAVLPGDTSIKLTGNVNVTQKLDYIFNSNIESNDLRIFASLFGIDLAKHVSKANKNSIFKKSQLDFELSGNLETIKISILKAIIDATNLTGNIGFVFNEDKNFVLVEANASKLSFDKYFNLMPNKKSSFKENFIYQINLAPWKGNFETEANINIANAIYNNVPIEKLKITFTSNDNKLVIKDFSAQNLAGADVNLAADISNVYTNPTFNDLTYTIKTSNFPIFASSLGIDLGEKPLFKRKLFSAQGALSGNTSKFSLSSIQKFGDVEFLYTGDISFAKDEKEVYKGDIELKADNFTNFVHDIGFDYTPDIPATSFTIAGAIKGNNKLFDISNFNAYLGANNIAGSAIIDTSMSKANLVANVDFDKFDVNRMLNISQPSPISNTGNSSFIKEPDFSSNKIDLSFMKKLNFDIKSNISNLVFNGKNYSDSVIDATLTDNNLVINKFNTTREDSNINLTFNINGNNIPKISGNFDVTKFNLPAIRGNVYGFEGGKIDADGTFNSIISSKKDFIDNLNSKGRFMISDATMHGWDLDIVKFELEQRKSINGFEDTVLNSLKSGKSTFSKIKGWYEINKGIVVVNESTWISPVVNMNMRMDLNLSAWQFNSEFNAFYNNASFSDILKFTFDGSLANPTITPNLSESIERINKLENVINEEKEIKEKVNNEQLNRKRTSLLGDIDDALLDIKRMSFDVTRFKPETNNSDVLKVYNSNIKELEEIEKNLKTLQTSLKEAKNERELMDLEANVAKETSRITFIPKTLEENYIVDSKYIYDDVFNKLTWLYNLSQNNTSYYNSLTDVYLSQIDFINTTETPVDSNLHLKAKESIEKVGNSMKKIDNLYNKMRDNYLTIIDTSSVSEMKNNNKTASQTLKGMLAYVKELSKETINSIDIFRAILGINARDYDLYMVYPPETVNDIDVNNPTVRNTENAEKIEDKSANKVDDSQSISSTQNQEIDKKKDNITVSLNEPSVGLSDVFNKIKKQKTPSSLINVEFLGLSNTIKNNIKKETSNIDIATNKTIEEDTTIKSQLSESDVKNIENSTLLVESDKNILKIAEPVDADLNEPQVVAINEIVFLEETIKDVNVNKESKNLIASEAEIVDKTNLEDEKVAPIVSNIEIKTETPIEDKSIIIAENKDVKLSPFSPKETNQDEKSKPFFTTDILNKTKNVINNFMSKITQKKASKITPLPIAKEKIDYKEKEIAENNALEKKIEKNIEILRSSVEESIDKDIIVASIDEIKDNTSEIEDSSLNTEKHVLKVNPVVAMNIGHNTIQPVAEIEIASKLKKKAGFEVKPSTKQNKTTTESENIVSENIVVAETPKIQLSKKEFLSMLSDVNKLHSSNKNQNLNRSENPEKQYTTHENDKNKYIFARNDIKREFSGNIGKSILSQKDNNTIISNNKNKYLFAPSHNSRKTSGTIGKKFALSVK